MSDSHDKNSNKEFRQLGGDSDWWRSAVVYQIYPRSYLDTTGDGVGDLAGISQKLDYLAELGVDAVWISPFFTSPMKDFGYDVSDYRGIDPMFGSHEDFALLLEKAHSLGIRILIDLVLSHTSDQHEWWQTSKQSRDNEKADWYVWADPKKDGSPPTNWLSIFGGSAWEWDAVRRQYFLHNFLTCQPDLNFHNMDVQDALLDVTRFWLDLGVDGFRLDTANMYFHDAELRDNPPVAEGMVVNGIDPANPYAMQEPKYNISRPETLGFMERFRAVLDEYPAVTSVGELGAVVDMYTTVAAYTEAGKRLHMGYSFDFMTHTYNAPHIRSVVERMQQHIGSGWPCWAFSNHDVERVVSRWGVPCEAATMLTALSTSLAGTACMYQGEELGLPEAEVAFEDLQDPFGIRFWPGYKGRDGCRTPMPWQADESLAGFSSAERSWLPVSEAHLPLAVSEQQSDDSVLQRTRHFLQWRKQQPTLLKGDIHFIDAPEGLLAFVREYEQEKLLCVFQLDGKASRFDTDFSGVVQLNNEFFGSEFFDNDSLGGTCVLPAYGMFFGIITD